MKAPHVATAIIAVVTLVLIAFLWGLFPGLLLSWESRTYDARARWLGSAAVSDALVIIARDVESDARFGGGIWDRAVFAKMIGGLRRAGAAVVALDFHFEGESPTERGGPASDRALSEATATAGNVLLPLPVSLNDEARATATVPSQLKQALSRSAPALDQSVLVALPRASRMAVPLPDLVNAAKGWGHIGAVSDPDGVYRRVPAFVNVEGQGVPSLGVAMAAAYLNVLSNHLTVTPGNALVFQDAAVPGGQRRTLSVPIDREGNVLITYAGRWTDGPFPYLSFVDVWDAIQEGREAELREQVAGRAVLIVHAALESDKRQTPLELTAPGGFILANVFNTVLTESAPRTIPGWMTWALVILLAGTAAWCLLAFPHWIGLTVALLLGAAYLMAAYAGFALNGIVMPMILPLMALTVATGGALAWTRWLGIGRIRQLEGDYLLLHRELAEKQHLVVQRDTRVEQLEDDLQNAQTEVAAGQAQSAQLRDIMESLQQRLRIAQEEATQARQAVNGLQARLNTLQAAQVNRAPLPSREEEALRAECAAMGILTRDPGMLRCWTDLRKAARSRTPMLILGEPGTGKELFARAVHRLSERAACPFVPVNMAAVPPDLFESELFGHVRGAFTGAVRDHQGYFLQADRGTIFLDEIGDLRADLQAKLLRVLQEGSVMRVGDRKAMTVDVRLVSATNRNLLQGIAEGWFREDLYYRLHGIELRLPPLRERQGDVAELAQGFVDQVIDKEGRGQVVLSQGALDRLKNYPWRGNVRELKRCIENAVVLAEGSMILEQDLRLTGTWSASQSTTIEPVVSSEGDEDPRKKDPALLRILREHSFDLQATAATLGWDRSTVMQRLKGMCFQALVQANGSEREAASSLAGEPGLTRLVEVKLKEYLDHLKKVASAFPSQEAALAGCRKRFKNLPERYHASLAELVRRVLVDNGGRSG
jgi:transcriptional regulator with PAS, ATPase and Fis domain/CHASE2 domain-containing sensor protein